MAKFMGEKDWLGWFVGASLGWDDMALVSCLNDGDADAVILGQTISPGHTVLIGTVGECRKAARMYGWPIDSGPAPELEKSPQDKALEDFIAKREAKRRVAPGVESPTWTHQDQLDARGWDLDRAMSKLIPAEKDFRSRLVNVKVPNE